MLWYYIPYLSLALFASWRLLASPYLRITSLGWLLAIWLIPIVGALFFILTVVRRSRRRPSQLRCGQNTEDLFGGRVTPDIKRFETLARAHHFFPYFRMKSVEILSESSFIERLYKAIEQANIRIWITTYIFSGEVKTELIKRLSAAHERGVEVRLLVDRVGSGLLSGGKATRDAYHSLPFHTAIFHNSLFNSLFYIEKRLHSKIVVIDNNDAFIGSHNLRAEVLDGRPGFAKNVSLRFSGSVVKQLDSLFVDLWCGNSGENIAKATYLNSENSPEPKGEGSSVLPEEGIPAKITFSDPIEGTFRYNRYFTSLFYAAQTRILIWMPYIIPTQGMRDMIISAAKLGLEVKVLIPKKSDSLLVDNAHSLVLREFVENGVQCAQGTGAFDHSKIVVIDYTTILGSTNLDFRSLFRNYEANLEVNDPVFTGQIIELFEEKFAQAEQLSSVDMSAPKMIGKQITSLIAGLY